MGSFVRMVTVYIYLLFISILYCKMSVAYDEDSRKTGFGQGLGAKGKIQSFLHTIKFYLMSRK